MTSPRIEVGRLGAAHGVHGWLRVQSFTDPPERLFEWQRWMLQRQTGDRAAASREPLEVTVLQARPQRGAWVVKLEGVDGRDEASRLTGLMVLVERAQLPPSSGREHYRADLVGFEVRNVEGALLGVVEHFIDTPANAVMVIKGTREHLVPVTSQHVLKVDDTARAVLVDWPEDF